MMASQRPIDHSFFTHGFTLVEMSVVLVVIGLLILTVFPALTVSRVVAQRAATQSNLNALMLATAAYVQANGCLPCPTPASVVGSGFGHVRGDTNSAACSGCATAEGIPPYASLGIPANTAHDGWGHWISMRIDPALTASVLGTIVPPTVLCSAAALTSNPVCKSTTASQNGLCQASLGSAQSGGAVKISTLGSTQPQPAAVIFVSHGSKGYGAYEAGASPLDTNHSGGCRLNFPDISPSCLQLLACVNPFDGTGYAKCNATGSNSFWNPSPRNDYDDMMVFADRNALVSMLGNGACQSGS